MELLFTWILRHNLIRIADSGSPKTDWRFIDGDKLIKSLQTNDFNPYYQNVREMADEPEYPSTSSLDHSTSSAIFTMKVAQIQ